MLNNFIILLIFINTIRGIYRPILFNDLKVRLRYKIKTFTINIEKTK